MRIWLHLALVAVSLGMAWSLRPTPPESELRHKAQTMLDRLYGRGHAHVTVTQHRGHGRQTVSDTRLGDRSLVLQSQKKHEVARSTYKQEVVSEKLEVPRTVTLREEKDWVERTGVAVVVDVPPGSGVEELLEAGLGLDRRAGDQISVVQAHH